MPSPTSTTVPTLRVSVPASNPSIADLMMLVISSERMAIGWDLLEGAGARDELVPQSLETASDAAVDQSVADADDEAGGQGGIDVEGELDATAGQLLQPGGHGPDLVLRQGGCAGGGGEDDALAGIVETPELGGHARELVDAG